jgi:hypothetical protein
MSPHQIEGAHDSTFDTRRQGDFLQMAANRAASPEAADRARLEAACLTEFKPKWPIADAKEDAWEVSVESSGRANACDPR